MIETLIFATMTTIGAISFAIMFRVPKRFFVAVSLIACFAGVAIQTFPKSFHVGFATFVVSLFIASLCHLAARKFRQPAQIFLIPSIIFLVPGSFLYRGFQKILGGEINAGFEVFFEALLISAAISFGVLIANWIVPSRNIL